MKRYIRQRIPAEIRFAYPVKTNSTFLLSIHTAAMLQSNGNSTVSSCKDLSGVYALLNITGRFLRNDTTLNFCDNSINYLIILYKMLIYFFINILFNYITCLRDQFIFIIQAIIFRLYGLIKHNLYYARIDSQRMFFQYKTAA